MKPLNLALEYLLDELKENSPGIMGIYEEWSKGDHRESLLSLVESALDGSRRFSALVQAIEDIAFTKKAFEDLFYVDFTQKYGRWLAVNLQGQDCIFTHEPKKIAVDTGWQCGEGECRILPDKTIRKVTDRVIMWTDDPIDLLAFNINNLKLEYLK